MFEITSTTQRDNPNAFAKAEREKPWISRKSVNEWRVVPRKLKDGSREHGKYIVRFVQWGGRVFGDCVNILTGERCKSRKLCYHRAAALKHIQRLESRELSAA